MTTTAAPLWPVRVGFADVDQMRVAHHARHWLWFEEARFHFLREVLALDVDEIAAVGVFTPLVDARCRYLRAARWGETLGVRVRLAVHAGARLVFHHELLDGAGQCLAQARTTHVFTDVALRLRCTIPAPYADRIAAARTRHPEAFVRLSDAEPRRRHVVAG